MTDLEKAEPRVHGIRWLPDDWKKVEEAARIVGEREHMEITPTDIIRSGALRWASEILAGTNATTQPAA